MYFKRLQHVIISIQLSKSIDTFNNNKDTKKNHQFDIG